MPKGRKPVSETMSLDTTPPRMSRDHLASRVAHGAAPQPTVIKSQAGVNLAHWGIEELVADMLGVGLYYRAHGRFGCSL